MTTVEVAINQARRVSPLDESGLLSDRYTLANADNATLVLHDGSGNERVCTDLMAAYASVNFGHRNPDIDRALSGGSDLAALFSPAEAESVAEWLCSVVSDSASRRVLYQVGGSFAVSTALALARRRRPGRILAIEGAFHGLGQDALAATTVHRDLALQETGLSGLLQGQMGHLTPGTLPDNWDDVSALIYEPVQGANGYVPLDRSWLAVLESSARAAGVTVIADEIQCGFHRHGPLSVSAEAGLDPDIVLFGKSLTNGMYPLSAVVYRRSLEQGAAAPVYLSHTFQTGALGFAAAAHVAHYLATADVTGMCERVGSLLSAAAARWSADGLVRDVHVTGPTLSFAPAAVSGRDVVRAAFRRNVLIFTGGAEGERIRIAPPLTIPQAQLAAALDAVGDALRENTK